jgi:hypothetical protein
MAEGEEAGGEIGRGMGRIVDLADHPLLFALSITLMVIAMSALLYWLFERLGLPGPATLFR